MTEKLKSCPFCGGEAKIEWIPPISEYAVECQVCGMGSSTEVSYKDKSALIKLWNTRAADENPPLTLDELRGMNGEPVWIESKSFTGWAIILRTIGLTTDYVQANGKVKFRHANGYHKTWLAYRRRSGECVEGGGGIKN